MTKIITLSGLGELEEDGERESIAEVAKAHGAEFYPTYYDHELKGTPEAVEAVTVALWSMKRDEWSENALTESDATPKTLKRYTVEAPAVLSYVAITETPEEAMEQAREEFYGLLDFLSKSAEGAQVIGQDIANASHITETEDEHNA